MARPRYETTDDLGAERAVVAEIERELRASLRKLPEQYKLDYAAYRDDQLCAWVEIKCRAVPSDHYPTLILSVAKWHAGVALACTSGVPFVVVAKFVDGAKFVKYSRGKPVPIEYRHGGRKDRGDAQDMEPVVHIPAALLKPLRRTP